MNFNEEMQRELNELNLGGKVISIKEEDKGTPEDYAELEAKLILKDAETTRMIRESQRNSRLGLPCGSSLVETTINFHQELTQAPYGIDALQRIFLKTSVSDYFVKDNGSKCDSGSVSDLPHIRTKKIRYNRRFLR